VTGIQRGGCKSRPIEDQVWSGLEQQPILFACRLALGPIGHNDRASLTGRDSVHLDGNGEPGATATAQAATLNRVDQLTVWGIRPWRGAKAIQMLVQADGAVGTETG
jgi:hypothetical protein